MIPESREVRHLRPDVAVNCNLLLAMTKAAGFNIGLASTYRSQKRQTELHLAGVAPPVVTFHGVVIDGQPAALAFDVYENLNGKTSYRDEFFAFVAPLAKKMGFTWLYDITGGDKPHFQWDAGRKYRNADILARRLPPPMPLWEDEDMLEGEEIYKRLNDYLNKQPFPEWAKAEFEEAKKAGITDGTNPFGLVPRYQAAIMALRAIKKAKSLPQSDTDQ